MDIPYKFSVLRRSVQEHGFWKTCWVKVLPFLLSPVHRFIRGHVILLELFYGVIPSLLWKLPWADARFVRVPKGDLVDRMRMFWYKNSAGSFDIDGEKISRREIFVYGGPNSFFKCPQCQKWEWLSRIRQKNLFRPHECKESLKCETFSRRQGDELWTHYHQNFSFSIGVEEKLPAPKGLYITFDKDDTLLTPRPAYGDLVFRRQLAYASQIDVAYHPVRIDWKKYDFLYMYLSGSVQKFPRPNLPIILYAHDFWPLDDRGYQWLIDWLQPEILLTSYPTQWQTYFTLPSHTKVVFAPLFESTFFARPNPDGAKSLDLLVTGATSATVYAPRRTLNQQLKELPSKYRVEFSHLAGYISLYWQGPTFQTQKDGGTVRFLNKWSEYLGSAKYVIFGNMVWPMLVGKYYESLGSGAIPIFSEVPDLKRLDIKAFEHYIPLSEVEGNNEQLQYFLDHYEDFRYIAKNAVNWYHSVSDQMLFRDFESLINEITEHKYPKRLLESKV